jgi:holo-[acyl-carrier protein] synthase
MAIFGIGVDIFEIERLVNVDTTNFANRILSQAEFEALHSSQNKLLFLAKKFCVKEAVSKAFGVGIGKNLSFKDITISKNPTGKPLCFIEESIYMPITQTICNIHISYSDTKALIQAYCVIETIT